jgi:hypothetical protein|tara:strand:- start:1213 stop:2478 length:1266 start_codon:yes stop_codon:yes gene_type:complete
MDKISVVISSPVDTYSGYGARARDFVKAVMALGKYDVKLLSQRWGNTRFGYLEDHGEEEMLVNIIPQMTSQPDVWIQITVPNEFQKVGKYNIGVTAGIETTLCAKEWIDGLNRMDLVLTSSNHSKSVLEETKWDIKDNRTNQIVETTKATVPIEVLFEGIDNTKYNVNPNKDFNLSTITEEFCFLFVGHWLQGDFGHDRKNIGYMIKSFLETFKNKPKQPALVLKTSHVGSSIIDQDRILKKIDEIRQSVKGKLPNIYLVHGEVSDTDMNNLYNHPKIKAMVSFTKGEGFGRPLLEFSVVKKPIIASGWSGQTDFLNNKQSFLVGGKVHKLHKSSVQKGVLLEESEWFQPEDGQVGASYKEIYKNYKKWVPLAKQLGYKNSKEFSFEAMTKLLGEILDKSLPEFPKQVELELPKLDLPKLK